MKSCDEVRQVIPWYVEGQLSAEENVAVAMHVSVCGECVRDVAEAVRLRSAVNQAYGGLTWDAEAIWERVARQAVGRRIAQLDVGSFLVGLRLGAWLTRRGSPVRADLRVLGREVRLTHRRKGGESS